jgi:ribosomal protein S27E
MTNDRIAPPGPATVIDCPWCAATLDLPTAGLAAGVAAASDLALACPACGTTAVLAGGPDGGRRNLPVAA